ncbi:hypothetical protein AB0425_41675 [Actinosynnema sp. NPDC051121]
MTNRQTTNRVKAVTGLGPDAIPTARQDEDTSKRAAEVRLGDVLLSLGSGPLSRAIALFDGGEVSHAALALGEGQLAEATDGGLRRCSITASAAEHERMVARRLSAEADTTPVADVARRYLDAGGDYAYQQIVLLAVLAGTRRAPLPASGRRLLRAVLDQAAGALNTMLEHGRTLMICSEFVYRCHHEARPAAPYVLDVGGREPDDGSVLDWALDRDTLPSVVPPRGNPVDLGPLVAEYAADSGLGLPAAPLRPSTGSGAPADDEDLLRSLVGFGSALGAATGTSAGDRPRDGLEAIRAYAADPNFVTPGDLARTASLTDRVHIL